MAKHLPTAWHRPFLAETGLSHLMDEFFGDFTDVGFDILPSLGWTDVFEKDGSVIYEMKLPGVAKDDVEMKVDQGRLVVSGEVRRNEEVKQKNSFRIGRRHGQFPQCLRFPLTSRTRVRSVRHSGTGSSGSPSH